MMNEYRNDVVRFVDSGVERNTVGLVYGRRRIGKSTLLEQMAHERSGFYWEATRQAAPIQLVHLGEEIGAFLGVGPITLDNWESAFRQLLRLGSERSIPIVLDEFNYALEAAPAADSILASTVGPRGRRESPGQARLILCGSAIGMMRALTAKEAPLRGRAGMELVMQADDFRRAARRLGETADLALAIRVFAVIGGVVGYATDMVDFDLPDSVEDFDRWVTARLLSPAATLHHEATTLLAEDPTLSTSNPMTHHSILGAIANGSITSGKIANRMKRSVSNIEPSLKRLIESGFVVRHADPIRAQRPTYALSDPFLQFHYAVLEPNRQMLRARAPRELWARRLLAVFDMRVRGPVFEEQVRVWCERFADPETLGGEPDHVGPSSAFIDGVEHQLDVVIATSDPGDVPASSRTVVAIGEAKSGEIVGKNHVKRLEQARAALGVRAAQAKLLLFAPAFTAELRADAAHRADIELIDLERLYHGA